jgi:opacity protein-like surface antigen
MKILVVAFALMVAATTSSYAQDSLNYGVLQAGVASSGLFRNNKNAALGAEFGETISRNLQIYLSGGWLKQVDAWSAWHLSGGVKLMLPGTTRARPYALGGVGGIQFRNGPLDHVNQFLAEIGGGVAFAVGRDGYIDISYRFMQPYEVLKDLRINGLYAGFGFRY